MYLFLYLYYWWFHIYPSLLYLIYIYYSHNVHFIFLILFILLLYLFFFPIFQYMISSLKRKILCIYFTYFIIIIFFRFSRALYNFRISIYPLLFNWAVVTQKKIILLIIFPLLPTVPKKKSILFSDVKSIVIFKSYRFLLSKIFL